MAETDPVLTLRDLDTWSFDGTALAVLGQPIKHSISPAMHNAALAAMSATAPRFARWRYFRFEVAPDDLPEALERLRTKDFLGLNLTVPHKVLAMAHVAEVDLAARPIGAVNTLLATPAGWHGHNTDGHGLATGLREQLGRDLHGSHVILLGAGGAARGIAVECLQRGCASLSIANRTPENLRALLDQLASLAGRTPLRGFAPMQPPADLPVGALVINATSAGLRDADPLPIDLAALPRPAGVYDTIYNPAQTRLLRAAEKLGLPFANGLSMLVHQGARSLSLWTNAEVPVTTMRAAAEAALRHA
jgi:shikimate dehydrogenase